MSRYRFTDTQARVYVDRALVVEPGDVVDWPDNAPADGQWQPADGQTPPPAPAEPDTEPMHAGAINPDPATAGPSSQE